MSIVVDWKLLLLLDCDELCTTLTKMITTTEMNLMIFYFFKFQIQYCCLFLGFESYWFLSLSNLCSKLSSWLVFFLIVSYCDEHMHHVDLSDKNYLSDCYLLFVWILIRLIRFSSPPFSWLIEAWNCWIVHVCTRTLGVWIFLLWECFSW